MRWNKIDIGYWECVFVNVPFHVKVLNSTRDGVLSILYFCLNSTSLELDKREYKTIDDAKSDVEKFVLDHLAQYSAQVHRECLNANVMTWRKLKEQLDQIPEDQLDEAINHLDTDAYWVGEPRIELAKQDQYMEKEDCRDVTGDTFISEDTEVVVEKGKYFLSTCEV